jgi:hypothetical protein
MVRGRRQTASEHARVQPRDVAGFAAAAAAGRTPHRPTAPPHVVPPVARHALVGLAVTIAFSVVVPILCLIVLPTPGGRIGGTAGAAFAAAVVVGFVAVRQALGRFRAAFLKELNAGYTTTTFDQGLFWLRSRDATDAVAEDVIGWDWRGVWVLRASGTVVSSPDPSLDPPGLYPSPTVAGRYELWTGCRWSGVFLTPSTRADTAHP